MKKTIKYVMLPILMSALMLLTVVGMAACGEPTVPDTVPGQSTIIDGAKGKPSDYDAKYVAYAVAGKLASEQMFSASVTGNTVAKKGFITYEQKISNKLIKHGDEFYSNSESTSTFVNVKHEAFVKNSQVAYRNDGGDIKLATNDGYADVYGVIPGMGLDGHILNDETILNGKKVSSENGLNVYEYIIDKEKGSPTLKKQMKEFGGLSELPVFNEHSVLKLTVKDDWTPVELVTTEQYSISVAVLGSMDCAQNITCTFENFGGETSIPDTEAFNRAMNSTPSVVQPGNGGVSDPALEGLIGALVESDLAGGISLRGVASACGISVPIDIGMSVDVNAFSSAQPLSALKLSIATNFAGLSAKAWLVDGKLYINASGNKYVCALPEIAAGADIADAVKISKTSDGYSLSLTDIGKASFGTILQSIGLASEPSTLECDVKFYVPTDRVGGMTMTLATDRFDSSINLTMAEKKFVEPENPQSYKSEISQNISMMVRLPLMFNLAVPVGIDFSYDLSDPNPVSALNANIKIYSGMTDPNDGYQLKYMLQMMTAFMPEGAVLPEIVSTLSAADIIELSYIGDGSIYLTFSKFVTNETTGDDELKVFYFQKLDMSTLFSGLLGTASAPSLLSGNGFSLIDIMGGMNITVGADGFQAELAGVLLDSAKEIFEGLNAQIIDLLSAQMGEEAAKPILSLLGIGNELENIRLEVAKDENGYFDRLEFSVSVYVPAIDGVGETTVNKFFAMEVDFNGTLNAPIAFHDFAALAALDEQAAVMREEIDTLKNEFTLVGSEAYLARIDEVQARFDVLDEDVKLFVHNAEVMVFFSPYSVFASLKDKVGTGIENGNSFLTELSALPSAPTDADYNTLDSAYDDLTNFEVEYIKDKSADKVQAYLTEREQREAAAQSTAA